MPLSKEILKIATLGTAHHGIDVSVLGKSEHLERQLLRSIAGTKLPERAGWIPMVDEKPLPEPFPADERPICSLATVQLLSRVIHIKENEYQLTFEQKLSLKRWLDALDKKGQRIAPEFLMYMLYWADNVHEQRSQIFELMDEYSQRILADIPMGTTRSKLLKFLWFRENDPSQWAIFVEQWEKLTTSYARSNFLRIFQHNMVASDEEFLEGLVDTVRWDVLEVLRELLAELPNARFSKMIIDTVQEFVSVEQVRGKERLAVKPLNTLDNPMLKRYLVIQEGISTKSTIQRLLSYVPPSFWCHHFEISHEKFVELIVRNRKISLIFWKALANASHYHQDGRFADDIFDHAYRRLSDYERNQVIRLISPEKIEGEIVELIDGHSDVFSQTYLPKTWIKECEAEWSVHFSEIVLRAIRGDFDSLTSIPRNYFDGFLKPLLLRAAFHIPLMMRDDLLGLFDDGLHDWWQGVRQKVQQILEFRQELNDLIEVGTI